MVQASNGICRWKRSHRSASTYLQLTTVRYNLFRPKLDGYPGHFQSRKVLSTSAVLGATVQWSFKLRMVFVMLVALNRSSRSVSSCPQRFRPNLNGYRSSPEWSRPLQKYKERQGRDPRASNRNFIFVA
jgi:hypothetical protein